MVSWDYNKSDAFGSVDSFHDNFNWSYNASDYPSIQNMTQTPMSAENETMAENSINALFTPITDYWAAPGALGAWFYVIVMFFTIMAVYAKTKRLEPTVLVMLFMSILVAAPATAGIWIVPPEVVHLMYISTAMAMLGVFYLVLTAGGRR